MNDIDRLLIASHDAAIRYGLVTLILLALGAHFNDDAESYALVVLACGAAYVCQVLHTTFLVETVAVRMATGYYRWSLIAWGCSVFFGVVAAMRLVWADL